MWRKSLATLAFATWWPAVVAAADPPADPPADTAASEDEVQAALRAARAEIDALAMGAPPAARPAAVTRARSAPPALPPSMTSEIPATGDERPERPPADWLAGIALPDFPVRWDDRLVSVLEYYRSNDRGRAHITAWLERSGRYEGMIRRALRDAGLPEDLLYVAMVESGFNPTIVSPAKAVGLWQFTAPTAEDYGLAYDRWIDERKSPERATQAAVRFLGDLHESLGSWPLALAAFNMGHGALKRAVRKYNTNDFWLLSRLEAGLPYETIAYVHKITACAIVGRNLERFGLADVERDAPIAPARVNVSGGTGLGRIARAARMPVDELAALNPELRRKRIPPDVREWPVRIPQEHMERFRKSWPELRAARPSHAEHVLRWGERLKDVAEMYGTSVRKLRLLNDLGATESVRPGARLRVPDVEPEAPKGEDGPVTVGVPRGRFQYADRNRVFYRVLGNESLDALAAFFQVSVDDIERWNDVSRAARLPKGLVLQIFAPKGVDLSGAMLLDPKTVRTIVVGSEAFYDGYEAAQGRARIRYRIKEGDTLHELAKRFDLSVGSIARINGFSTSTDLQPGTEIIVYTPADSKAAKHARRN